MWYSSAYCGSMLVFWAHILEANQTKLLQIVPDVKQTLATVIITHYNYSNFVEHALCSVLAQRHLNFECIIVDDCSAPTHLQKLKQIITALADTRIQLVELPENKGQTNAVFEGLKNSTGEFVSLLDPDDLYEPLFIEKMLRCHLNPCVSAAVAACEMGLFRIGGSILSKSYVGFKRDAIANNELPKFEASQYDFGFSKFYPAETTSWLWATTSSLMFRRDALEILRRKTYMQDTKLFADSYCVMGSHLLGGTLFLDEVLSWRGIHKNNAVESEHHFSSFQRRHQPEFVDTTKAIKAFVAKTILENDCLEHLTPDRLGKTLKSHFTNAELLELLADKPELALKIYTNAGA